MIYYAFSTSVIILIILLLRKILKHNVSAHFKYSIWVLLLLYLVIPIHYISTPLSVFNVLPDKLSYVMEADFSQKSLESDNSSLKLPDTYNNSEITTNKTDLDSDSDINLSTIIRIIWYVGIAITGISFIISNILFYTKLKRNRKPFGFDKYNIKISIDYNDSILSHIHSSSNNSIRTNEKNTEEVIKFLLSNNNKSNTNYINLPIYTTDFISSPCLYGLFKPCIYINTDLVNDSVKLTHVLSHELSHYHHFDHVISLFRSIAVCIHWYNPLVWIAAFVSKRDGELSADESTVKKLGYEDRLEYGKTLISFMSAKAAPNSVLSCATTMMSDKSGAKERITNLAQKNKPSKLISLLLIIFSIIVCTCAFTNKKTIINQDNIEDIHTIFNKSKNDCRYDEKINLDTRVFTDCEVIDVDTNLIDTTIYIAGITQEFVLYENTVYALNSPYSDIYFSDCHVNGTNISNINFISPITYDSDNLDKCIKHDSLEYPENLDKRFLTNLEQNINNYYGDNVNISHDTLYIDIENDKYYLKFSATGKILYEGNYEY